MISANTELPIESTQSSSIATCNVGTKNLSTRNQEVKNGTENAIVELEVPVGENIPFPVLIPIEYNLL